MTLSSTASFVFTGVVGGSRDCDHLDTCNHLHPVRDLYGGTERTHGQTQHVVRQHGLQYTLNTSGKGLSAAVPTFPLSRSTLLLQRRIRRGWSDSRRIELLNE
ncbi:hypothetical protein GQ600_7820 [Phytophthora cactorum]|nr:hypothetical protein GQ600_7820 [Phytophthora cactorum]